MLTYVLATVFVLGILILIHEMGHFMVAKAVDIRVPRFSIGLGPKLIGFKRGETEYCLSAIPFGGYVKMAGETTGEFIEGDGEDKVEEVTGPSPRDFDQKPIWARVIVVSAGSTMNFVWGFTIFFFLAYIEGIPFLPLTPIGKLDWGEAGPVEGLSRLEEGDRITEVSGVEIESWGDVFDVLAEEELPLSLTWTDSEGNLHREEVSSADSATRARLAIVLEPAIPPRVGQVQKGSPAERAGFRQGDLIVSIDEVQVDEWSKAVTAIKFNPEKELDVKVLRDGGIVNLKVTPERKVLPADGDSYEEVGQIGILSDVPMRRLSLLGAVRQGALESYYIAAYVLLTVEQLITGEISPRMLGGPVMIGELAGNRARWGFAHLMRFMALFSVNLAVLNILPIPILDGGHVLFLLIEKLRGKPLSEKVRMRLSQVGMILLILMMVYVTANDGLRLLNIY